MVGKPGNAISAIRTSRLASVTGNSKIVAIGSGRGYHSAVLPRETQVGTPSQRSRMLLLVLGVGAATGLHLGLLHWFMWRSWTAPVTFLTGSLFFAGVSYLLWRRVLPLLRSRHFVLQVALETLVCLVTFTLVSICVTGVMGAVLAAAQITPAAPIDMTPAMQR